MEEWQTGDVAAFEAFFRQHEKGVFKNAYLITGSRQDAEDVLQEVFTSVWKSRHTFDPNKGKVTTWLHRITVNECIRKHRREHRPEVRIDPADLADTVAEVGAPDYDRLTDAMEGLDTRHRAVLVLRYFNDLSYDEIARALDVPLGTVKSRINHALKILRKRLADG